MKNSDDIQLFRTAMALADSGQYESSLKILRHIESMQPDDAQFKFFIGLNELNLGNYQAAEVSLYKSLLLGNINVHVYQAYGTVLNFLDRFEDAIKFFNKGIKLSPDYPDIYLDKGLILIKQKRFIDALECFNKAIQLDTHYADAYKNQGVCYFELGLFQEAIGAYDASLNITTDPQVLTNKGNAYFAQKRYLDAEVCHKQAINLNKYFYEAHSNLSFLYLAQSNFSQGWNEYEHRLNTADFHTKKLNSSNELWDGKAEIDSLFIWSEQGIGDQVLYAGLFAEIQKIVKRLVVSVDQKLLSIFKRSFPSINFIGNTEILLESDYEKHIPLGSIASIFRPDVYAFKKNSVPYLLENIKCSNQILSKSNLKADGKRVLCGLSWRSSNSSIGNDKSILLDDFWQILQLENIDFVSLQYSVLASEKITAKNFDGNLTFFDDYDFYEDLDSLISLINACDIVITVSNTTAHLAGALGKKTLLLLPYSKGVIWYWNECNGKNLWYPSVTTFRQKKHGDWSGPLLELKGYLEENFD